MLKAIHIGNSQAMSIPVDPTAEFQPGMIAQLKIIGNDIVAGVSNGAAPFGIIDDVRTNAFTKPQIDEIVVIEAETEIDGNGKRVSIYDEIGVLEFPLIVEESFVSDITVALNSINAIITVPAGTEVNYDADNDGINDSFKVITSYVYRIANTPGEDSTIGSGRITVYYARGVYAVDQYDTTAVYALNATLYVGLDGKLTTRRTSAENPGVAYVTGPPSAINGTLEFMWL
jgi:hypothetical protein